MNEQWMPQIHRDKCTGCGDCVSQCPTGALARIAEKATLLHPDLCTYCNVCEEVCPAGAIELPFLIMRSCFNEETIHA